MTQSISTMTSGYVTYNKQQDFYTSGYSNPPVINCTNCGSNHIVAYECQHCGTWYGRGAKPKPVKIEWNPTPITYVDPLPQHQKPKGFFSRLFGLS